MNITFLVVGIASIVIGVIMMTKSKFYKYKTSDMLFTAKLRTFLSSAILALCGMLIVANELKKLL
ncbi:hypothetical protein HDF25_004943 [Pedobacter cryoconitis]|uniref:Uncharacterized protein n=1 Tax=Pedobacter cryoconitis TaxID=188932 RepID=A0A7X0MMA4_9SPHI|nr:hypothetical protein [Pedobacter cryoconitis]